MSTSMEDSSSSSSTPLHVAIFPFLSRSHMPALFDLAVFFSSKGIKSSIITTPANSHHFLPFHSSLISLHLLPFPLETQDLSLLPSHLSPQFLSVVDSLSKPLSKLLSCLKPDALISDALYHWAPLLARSHQIPHIAFNIIGVFPSSAITQLSSIPQEDLHTNLPLFIPNFPYEIQLHDESQLPQVLNHPLVLNLYLKAERESHAVLYNSFYDLEPQCTDMYRQLAPYRKVLLVGPTYLLGKSDDIVKLDTPNSRDPILEWLDGKDEGSVLYVSFGTTCRFEGRQLYELALGLEASGSQFVWVVRNEQDDDTWIPEGYEQRILNRGLVVRKWAPQREILAHKAIGGFMSHCGWNSIIETVCSGVPIATWPLGSEQFLNERFIVDILKIGVEVRRKDGLVTKEEVVKKVRELMEEREEKKEMRRRVKELQESARRSVEENGSSYKDLNCLIEDLYNLRKKETN